MCVLRPLLLLLWSVAAGGYVSKSCGGPALDLWGINSYRQLGFNDQVPRYSPTTLPLPNNEHIQCFVMGGYNTAVQTVTGQWYAFGRNDYGQLGLGHASVTTTAQPIPPINGFQVVDVLLGDWFTFLRTANGVWYGVGYNDPGMLGLSNTTSRVLTPAPILIPPNVAVAQMVLAWYTAGLITTTGALYIWGDGTYGQIGNNQTTIIPYTTPQLVPLANVSSLALSIYNSYAITTNGKYYVWGLNRLGQLGIGNTQPQSSPTLLTPPNNRPVLKVITAYMTVAFLTDDGTWYMTGQNNYGQLGDISIGQAQGYVTSPVKFPLLGGCRVLNMVCGVYTFAGLTECGTWYIWGYNYDGELGLGNTNDVNVPQPFNLSRGEAIQHVAFGEYHSAAIRSATYTPTLTPTSTAVQCPGSKQFTTDTLAALLYTPCRSVYQGPGSSTASNVGSDSLFDRYLMVYVRSVRSGYTLEVDLMTGCVASDCCDANFTSSDAQSTTYLPVGSTPQVFLALGHHLTVAVATDDASRRSGDIVTSVELSMAYRGSVLLLGVACSMTALAMLLLWAGLWRRYWVRRERERSESRRRLDLPTEFAKALCGVLLAFGAWLLTTGVWWLIIGLLTTKPLSMMPALFITGCSMAGVGAVLIVGCGLYLLLDPVAVKCPECNEPVSRWKFRGTYVLSQDNGNTSPFSKAHTEHVRCQLCKRPVVQDRWLASAPCRPYHMDCWETFCSKAVMDRHYFNAWWENSQSQASKVELVHMLAMAITTKEMEAVERFAQLDPKLIFTPIILSGMRTPVQLAALFGHRDIVELLLQRGHQRTLDAACPIDPSAPKSMRIYSLEKEDNDLYLYQPQVLYNDQPVFVGHTNGKYIYYYEPCPEPGERKYAAGWCLSPHLGSGRCPLRLKLDDAISDKVAAKSGSSKLGEAGSYTPLLQRLKSWLLQKGGKRAPKEKEMMLLSDNDSWAGTVRPPTATMVPVEKTIEVQVDWVSHATSLLLDAITSGNQATIQFVLHLYHRQDQGCLKWQYRTRQGLWEAYPPAEQKDLHAAAALWLAEATLGGEEAPRTVLFEEREEVCGDERRPIRYTMQAIIQFTRKGLTVSSKVDSVWEWDGSCIVFAPSHAAAAAPDEETLAFLVEEGVVDYGLWSPPSHICSAWHVLSENYAPVLNHVMAEELCVALGDVYLQPDALSSLFRTLCANPRSPAQRAESRLTDGLTSTPQSDAHLAFYAPTYTSPTWSLPFCAALPANAHAFVFHEDLLLEMALDALKKGHELRRQGCPQPLRHALALFVYTYEMLTDDHTDQIYICMNRAMRTRDPRMIAFWRPLIWEVDQALQALPPLVGRSFRGINCQMDANVYKAGGHICWPSFSSASQSRSVAEEFAKGDSGTLFFLQGTSPRHIALYSRYPDEDEVLFGPNTVFEITTTLQQTSDIGQFYGKVDNIAMKQVGGSVVPGLKPRPVGYTSMLVHLPPYLGPQLLTWLSRMPTAGVESVDLIEERTDGVSAHVVVGDGPSGELLPNPLYPAPGFPSSNLVRRLPHSPPEEVPDPLVTGSRVVVSARRPPSLP